MKVSPSASSCNSDGCVVAGITVVGFRGAFAVTVVTGGVAACHWVMCWLRPFPESLLQLASGGSRFHTVEASSSSFSHSSLQRERERGEMQRGEGEEGLASFVP
ncbi:hypothetical protein DEO72_LG6g1748 [Vigna unguiculata]|uniref:Uncharacterized protein n=1 Tax=Vigna unguiculata TaxID=3917 RepID=A0A4D6M972_VIGUN|nr:hypothetical protein DEO72_LG6g1748 [Vigna unguiculata]